MKDYNTNSATFKQQVHKNRPKC